MATPDDPGVVAESALDATQQTISEAKGQLEEAREAQLAAAETAAERQAINDRIDGLQAQLEGLPNVIDDRLANFQGQLIEQVRSIMPAPTPSAMAGEGDTAFDDIIESIEEIPDAAAEGVTDLAAGAADAASATAEVASDVVPKREHPMFRKWFGGGRD